MEKSLQDLEYLTDERDQVREAMNEAINKCAQSLTKQQALEKENSKYSKQIENLISSKNLLQQTLTEQINGLTSQLDNLKHEKAETEHDNRTLIKENQNLREKLALGENYGYEIIRSS